jgi:hypothetical protein
LLFEVFVGFSITLVRAVVLVAIVGVLGRLLWWIAAEPAGQAWAAFGGDSPDGGWTLELVVTDGLACTILVAAAALVVVIGLTLVRELVVAAIPSAGRHVPAIGPPQWRRLIVATFGLTVLIPGATSQALAYDADGAPCVSACSAPLSGLQLPDLPLSQARQSVRSTAHTVVVRPGDSLWSLSEAMAPDASQSQIASRVARLYSENRMVIGTDPDLIQPGTILTVPGGDHDHER